MASKITLAIAWATLLIGYQAALGQPEDERVEWVFEIPSNPPGSFVGVGDDGSIYITDDLRLYALTPNGSLKWTLDGVSGGQPITFGDDGTLYTSMSGRGIAAVNPNGTLQWEYWPTDNRRTICGPSVGPDGHVYAVQEQHLGLGQGLYALNSSGKLLWTNPGDPGLGRADLGHAQIVFGPDRLYTAVEGFRGGFPGSWCFGLDGKQIWHSGAGGLEIPATSFPKVLPDGRVAFRWGQIGVMVIQPDGDVDWIEEHGDAGLLVGPAVGSDGVLYAGNWQGVRLWALNADGTTRWKGDDDSANALFGLTVAPDNSKVIATGAPGWIGAWVRGYDPANGDLLWQVDIPYENDLPPYIYTSTTAFSPDSQTAYVTVRYWDDSVKHSYLYAIRIGDGTPYDLSVENLVGGSDATFTITDATPNHEQFVVYSLRGLGSTPVGKLNITLDLAKPALVTSGKADGNGRFERALRIPNGVSGRTVWFQGAQMDHTTPVVEETVQ